MAKTRKKKKVQRPSMARRSETTKTYFDNFTCVARKVLILLDLDPCIFDRFTKRQKLDMMVLKMNPPRVKSKVQHSVPRHYLRKVQQEVYDFIKVYPMNDDDKLNLTYMDFFTYGMSFIVHAMLKAYSEEKNENKELFRQIFEKAESELGSSLKYVWNYLSYVLTSITKINFRIYGFDWEWCENPDNYCGGSIIITSVSPLKTHFTYNGKSRPAYQAIWGQYLKTESHPITIPYNRVIDETDMEHPLEVYIQNHVFLRMKERIDVFPFGMRLICLNNALRDCQSITLCNGQRAILMKEANAGVIGYLPFTIINNKLFVLTFLPICCNNAPEGKKLQKILGIGRNEAEYLGMHKLSFFIDTDFEAIPHLKSAVIEAGLWNLTKFRTMPSYQPQNPMSTANLSRFFKSEHTHEEVLNVIGEIY